jgi:FkbM family methyltransferase
MTPEAFVAALYRHVLGREAEPEGLRHWADAMVETGDPTAVLAAFLGSPEYRARVPAPSALRPEPAAQVRAALGGRPLRIVDVGAQRLAAENHVYSRMAAQHDAEIIGFDPLMERLRERAAAEFDQRLTLLPYALGDGHSHVLHVNEPDATSSLFPLNASFCEAFQHLYTIRPRDRIELTTRRLDDVLPPGPVDFLKLDVQGAELMVLKGAIATLASTAVIHAEVEFAAIYAGQPLFREVDGFLAEQGFSLIDLLVQHRYAYVEGPSTSPDRLIWADAVFFREHGQTSEVLAAQALASRLVYDKPSLAAHCERLLSQIAELPG